MEQEYLGVTYTYSIHNHYGSNYSRVTDIDVSDGIDTLVLTGFTQLNIRTLPKTFPEIKHIILDKTLQVFQARNDQFPNLCSVDGSDHFIYDKGLLIMQDPSSSSLLNAFRPQDPCIVDKNVKHIHRDAFVNTTCKKIIFEYPDVNVISREDPFKGSAWLGNSDITMMGHTIYHLSPRFEKETVFEIPGNARKSNIPLKFSEFIVTTPESLAIFQYTGLPAVLNIKGKPDKRYAAQLKDLSTLQHVNFEPNSIYCSVDGVVYTSDMKKLVLYPPRKKDKVFQIPDGVQEICDGAFAKQGFLQKLIMSDTVRKIGRAACAYAAISEIVFSKSLKRIEDAYPDYRINGIFEGCSIKRLTVPGNIKYIGDYSFFKCRLTEVILEDGVEEIGEYAFTNLPCDIQQITIPKSVKRLHYGCLTGIPHITMESKETKGLFEATLGGACKGENPIPSILTFVHTAWNQKDFAIPTVSTDKKVSYNYSWNTDADSFIENEAEELFANTSSSEQKLQIARHMLPMLDKDTDSVYLSYLKRTGVTTAKKIIENGTEKELYEYLSLDLLTQNALKALLKITNERQMVAASAYILQKIENTNGTKRTFSL